MSRQNVEVVQAIIPHAETDIASLFRDEARFERTRQALAPLVDPGFASVAVWQGGTTHVGMDGFRRMWLDWLQPWATYRSEAKELIDAGDRVVVLVRDHARRHDTDVEVELISGSVWTVRDGRVVRVEFCSDRSETLEVAGLSAQDAHPDS
jgi:ketosteroid isomerase-like protein